MTVPTDLDRRFRDAAARSQLLDAAYDVIDSELGPLLAAVTDQGLARISFDPEPEREIEAISQLAGRRVLRSPRALDETRTLSHALDALLANAGTIAGRAALFLIEGNRLKPWKGVGLNDAELRGAETSVEGKDLLARAAHALQISLVNDDALGIAVRILDVAARERRAAIQAQELPRAAQLHLAAGGLVRLVLDVHRDLFEVVLEPCGNRRQGVLHDFLKLFVRKLHHQTPSKMISPK